MIIMITATENQSLIQDGFLVESGFESRKGQTASRRIAITGAVAPIVLGINCSNW
jgi:hypothetical protein